MGRKKRLNRFITKWIKSDLPEERSTVLLLGVTRIPTSPVPARRPCSLPLTTTSPITIALVRNARKRNNKEIKCNPAITPDDAGNSPESLEACSSNNSDTTNTPTNPQMDRSVDSIGTCSLDVDASADLSDCSEISSVGTLRSISLKSPGQQETRLPSYLSLACTVNGYSTTTNYNPERLAKSRDTSPHRPNEPQESLTYAIHNNLLSPPNLVPLPMQKFNMAEQTITHHHQEFYTNKTISYISKESRTFTSTIYKDTVDACLDSKFRNGQSNGQSKISDCNEAKSFIQQRVERLYGPGALAQGFFVKKRQKSRSSESETDRNNYNCKNDVSEKHSKSMSDKLLDDDCSDVNIRQCTSSPSLPVLRHLTPEFRAQLPLFSPRKGGDSIQKSSTVPVLKDEVNGHDVAVENNNKPTLNGCHIENSSICPVIDSDTKDGHYFLKVLEKENVRLLALAEYAEEQLLTPGLNEDAKGFLRSASGKARLLVTQKMQQFKGLCTNNITQVEGEAFPTTNEDLQGFWDMVMLQVDQVDKLYKELEDLKANNWIEKKHIDTVDKPLNNTTKNRKVMRPQTAGSEEMRKKREAQRKLMIEERRRAMREQKQTPKSIEIFMPESS